MTCKDCIHYEEVCEYNNAALDDKPCAAFKDRSRFVELPCKVGDTLFLTREEAEQELKERET